MVDMLKLVRTLPDGKLIVVEDSLRHLSKVAWQNSVSLDDIMDDWVDLLDRKTHEYYVTKPSNTVPVVNVTPVPVANVEPVANVGPSNTVSVVNNGIDVSPVPPVPVLTINSAGNLEVNPEPIAGPFRGISFE